MCPIRCDEGQEIFLTDIIKMLGLSAVIVADAGLGTINAAVLTAEYLKNHGIEAKGVIVNNYGGGIMQEDNIRMIEELTGLPIVALVGKGDTQLDIDIEILTALYE